MTTMNLESILRQDDWLRRMARNLVSDPELADDLVQDAWVADLEGSGRAREKRSWLRGVLTNAGSKAFRRRRVDRERALDHARSLETSAPATDDIAAERQIRRRVGRELLALPEPEREALLLVYVADLPLKEAAERMGVAPSTAHKRATKGLRTLRDRLDRSFGGDRRAWSVALLTLDPERMTARATGGWSATAWAALGGVAAAALLTVVALRPGPHNTSPTSRGGVPVGAVSRLAQTPMPPRNSPTEPEQALASAEPRGDLRTEAPTSFGADQEDEKPLARISARFIEPDGTPAIGAQWRLDGGPLNDGRGMERGAEIDWEDLEGVIGDDGRLEIRFDPPVGYTFGLSVTLPGCAKTNWRFWKMSASAEKNFGTVRLEPECKIVGRIVDTEGEALSDRVWRVSAGELGRPSSDGRIEASVRVDVLEGQQTFEIHGLSAGLVQLSLTDVATKLRDRYSLVLENGPPLEREFLFDPARARDLRPRIHTSDINFGALSISVDSVTAVDGNGEEIPVTVDGRSTSELRIGTGSEQAMEVVIDDHRFDRWESGQLEPGREMTAHLTGSSQLTLGVVDAGGDPVELYSVALQRSGRTEPHLIHFGAFPLKNGLLDGIAAGTYDVIIRADGMVGRAGDVLVDPQRNRQVDVVLHPWVGVTGAVAFPNGEMAIGAKVSLLRVAEENDSRRSPIVKVGAPFARPEHRLRLDETTTDGKGNFTLEAPQAGTYALMAAEENKTWVVSDTFEVETSLARHDLVLPRGTMLSGHIELPDVLPKSGWEVHFVREGFQLHLDPMRHERPVLDALGSFEVTGLPPGRTRVFVKRIRDNVTIGRDGIPFEAFEVGSVDLEDGSHHKASFSLTDHVPSLVSITIEMDRDVSGETRAIFGPTTDIRPWSSSVVRGAGTTLPPYVLTAGVYTLHLEGDGWAILDIPLVNVPEGEQLEIPVDRELHEHRVRFMENGKPLVGGEISFWKTSRTLCKFPLDTDGWATIALTSGTFQIARTNLPIVFGDLEGTTISWPPQDQEIHVD